MCPPIRSPETPSLSQWTLWQRQRGEVTTSGPGLPSELSEVEITHDGRAKQDLKTNKQKKKRRPSADRTQKTRSAGETSEDERVNV